MWWDVFTRWYIWNMGNPCGVSVRDSFVLTGCYLLKIHLHHGLLSCQWAFHLLWCERAAVALSKTMESQKRLHKLFNNHIDIVILCLLIFWPAMHRGERQIHVFAWNCITLSPWEDSETHSLASCFSLPRERAAMNSGQTGGGYFLHKFSTF